MAYTLNLKIDEENKQYLESTRYFLGGIGYSFKLPTGCEISVIKHNASYGREVDLWEVGIFKNTKPFSDKLNYNYGFKDDVVSGYLTDNDVNSIIQEVVKTELREKEQKSETRENGSLFLEGMEKEQSKTYTENGATAYNTTRDDLVNLFATAGAMRGRVDEISNKFLRAVAEDELLATKLAFYTRDVRGGLGERDVSREMFKTLAEFRPDTMRENLRLIPEYGRWDDLLSLYNTPLKEDVLAIVKEQLDKDKEAVGKGEKCSLIAKWLPSVNTSSRETKAFARELCADLGLSQKEYRKTLSELRENIDVTERKMSAKQFEDIDYEKVPSYAMNRYRDAFEKQDEKRFEEYLEKVESGQANINAKTLYPYDITEKILYGNEDSKVLENQWKNLPNYIPENQHVLIMADVSGSMYGRPMATSVGLAVYFAERNTGPFENKFMTFTSEPKLVTVKGDTLREKMINVQRSEWYGSTNLEAAFKLVLDTAVNNNLPKEELPRSIVVISDMEINVCTDVRKWGFYDEMKERFENAGYEIPNIVFWNVNARNDIFHINDAHTEGVQLVSGQSAAVFKAALQGECNVTAHELMVKTLTDERYDAVKLSEEKMKERFNAFYEKVKEDAGNSPYVKISDYVQNKLETDKTFGKEFGIKSVEDFNREFERQEYRTK